ncbi:MAG: class I SAM-dependent methyltransferase [Candidatus Omnitrophota bacterium]
MPVERCFICEGKAVDLKLDRQYAVCTLCGLVFKKNLDKKGCRGNDVSPRSAQEGVRIEQKRMNIYRYFLKEINKRKHNKGRILDVGCGVGSFMGLVKQAGYEGYGIELSPQLASYAADHGLNVYNCSLEERKFQDDYFDTVTLINVLDFVADPYSLLLEIKRVLKKDGDIYLRVPNAKVQIFLRAIFSRFLSVFGVKKIGEFFNYGFSSKNVRKLLERAGFKNIKIENSLLVYGDVYRYKIPFITLLKIMYDGLSRIIYRISFRRFLTSTSIAVNAVK